MAFRPTRLRGGEILAGAGGVLLLVVLFGVKWYAFHPSGAAGTFGLVPSVDGWHAFAVLRWVILLTALLAVGLAVAQAACRAPALPVTLDVIVCAFAVISLVWLAIRLVFAGPDGGGAVVHRAGGWLALLALLAILVGGLWSLRREGVLEDDGPGEIPLVVPWEEAAT